MDLLDRIDDDYLRSQLREYIEKLHKEINVLQHQVKEYEKRSPLQKKKKDKRIKGSPVHRCPSKESLRIHSGWIGHPSKSGEDTQLESLRWTKELETNFLEIPIELLRPTVENVGWYQLYFYGREHVNYGADKTPLGAVFISVRKEYAAGLQEAAHFRILIRSKESVQRLLVPVKSVQSSTSWGEAIIRIIEAASPALVTANFKPIRQSTFPEALMEFEKKEVPTTFKFGILYHRANQYREEDMFSNKQSDISPHFGEFLQLLGDRIELNGWQGFNGGLDVHHNTTGEQSVFSEWRNFSIMFHVAPLLPHNDLDPQHIEKKRHLGNDIVLLVFQEEDAPPFAPDCITSDFIHVIIVVRIMPKKRQMRYQLLVYMREGVPTFRPLLPQPAMFLHNADFRDFLLCKCANGELASYQGDSTLASRLSKTRGLLLNNLLEKYPLDKSRRGSFVLLTK